jgi:catechol 2,3-dioxygenase-like lactoylglutathione lyase family enzyme
MKTPVAGFLRVKVITFSVMDPDRADEFYGQTLGLQPAFEGGEQVGYFLGDITLMLKENWYASPTQEPNPRVTMETDDALQTERELSERGVTISDPVKVYDEFYVGGFLDSEGNKLWFCSPVKRPAQTSDASLPSDDRADLS